MRFVINNRAKSLPATKIKRWNQLLFWYSFMMAFPNLLLFGQNASIFIFAYMFVFLLFYKYRFVITLRKGLQWMAVFFAIGSVLSVVQIPIDIYPDNFSRALAVLPNYLYWSFLLVFLVSNRSLLYLDVIYRGVFWGVTATVVYYIFLQNILQEFSIFKRLTPNSFAFLLVCYAPISVWYLFVEKSKNWALLFFCALLFLLLSDGRRAGIVLVFLGGIASLYMSQISWRSVLALSVFVVSLIFALQTSVAKDLILNTNERIYQLFYEANKIAREDRSYLIRVAMVNKGLAIFRENTYTGIGLNNFSNYQIPFNKDFEGAEYVIYKRELQAKSAHNSYIGILAEGGLFLFIPFVFILGSCLLFFLLNFFNISSSVKPIYYGLLAMVVHFYFISAVVNVYAWYLIGLACAFSYRK